jgi:hypothetical protein
MSVSLYGSGNTILQVVSATNNTAVSSTSATWTSTSVAATITPFATTSKILVRAICPLDFSANASLGAISIYRGGTQVFNPANNDGTNFITIYSAGGAQAEVCVIEYLDSPSTTSATTYTIYISGRSGYTMSINATQTGSPANKTSTITLMEVSGA